MAKSKVAIMTNFYEFNPGYSLTGIVLDQAEMLCRHGHDVTIFCNQNYKGDYEPHAFPQRLDDMGVGLNPILPNLKLVDYRSKEELRADHKEEIIVLAGMLATYLKPYDAVFTHDWVFTGWNLPYHQALVTATEHLQHVAFLHWVHSIPQHSFDWWDLRRMGPNHKLVYPNKTDAIICAEAYRTEEYNVKVIPHIKDMRTFYEFSDLTRAFIDDHPGVMQATVVQVLPASSDRLTAKRLREVMLIFKYIKEYAGSVCLVCANQWATGRQNREDLERYKRLSQRNNLRFGEEFIFTSEWKGPDGNGDFVKGVPRSMLRELNMLQNLFVFPTREESFGLVIPEAGLTGCLMVLNRSLQMMFEVSNYTALMVDFGSYHQTFAVQNQAEYLEDVAQMIVARMNAESAILAKTHYRKALNMDALYKRFYGPVLGEAKTWIVESE